MIDELDREVERAVIGRCKYRFKEQYSTLQVPESQWFRMTERQRLDHMKRVATAKVVVILSHPFKLMLMEQSLQVLVTRTNYSLLILIL